MSTEIKLSLDKVLNELPNGRQFALVLAQMLELLVDQVQPSIQADVFFHISLNELWASVNNYLRGTGEGVLYGELPDEQDYLLKIEQDYNMEEAWSKDAEKFRSLMKFLVERGRE